MNVGRTFGSVCGFRGRVMGIDNRRQGEVEHFFAGEGVRVEQLKALS